MAFKQEDEMDEWKPIETAPRDGTEIWVAFHGHGENKVQIVSWVAARLGRHGHWDYINSHDGQPQCWMPLYKPEPPSGLAGAHCLCDGCIEEHSEAQEP
jgi:hypothetical protein